MLRKIATTIACLTVIGVAASCASTSDKVTGTASQTPAAATSSAPAPVETTTEPEATTPTEEAATASTIGGAWITYESGIAVKVTKAKLFTPGQYSFGSKAGERGVAVTVSVKNGAAAAFDASLISVKLNYGPDGVTAEDLFDSEHGYGSGFEGSIAKGKTKTATVAFSMPAKYAKALSIEVEPDWDSETAFFTGGAK